MRLVKGILCVLGFLAAYKTYDVFIAGTPSDPGKALAEWEQQAKAGLPEQINSTTTWTKVSFRWQESNSLFYGGELKDWHETYEARISADESSLAREEQLIVAHICRSDLHRKVLALDMKIVARIVVPGTYLFKDIEISRIRCTGKS